MTAEQELDQKVPVEAVLRAVKDFLDECGWELEFEFDGEPELVTIPREPEPAVVSRAFIKAHAPDVFLGDHYEAAVALGPVLQGNNLLALAGRLRLYFNQDGNFVSEDRFPPVR